MNKRSIKIMALIAMILQALAAVIGIGMVAMQKTLLKGFMGGSMDMKTTVFPVALIFVIFQLIIYIVFFSISQREDNRFVGIVLIVLSVILAIVSVFGNVLGTFFYSRQQIEALAGYSGITTLMSYANTLFVIPAEALFYIACGRYTSKPE
ncbi:MAG: hypothetical protein K6A71_00200 [Lachnospiraceae bacterium]|nr:hypothetical protein [Lachnospiraceae bacterium]